MEVSKSQLSYLWAIKQLSGGRVSQKDISEYLNVKKPSASVALRNLEESGYILKIKARGENRYILDNSGWKIIEELERERFEFMALFRDLLGVDSELCNKQYNALYGSFDREFINKIAELHENNYTGKFMRASDERPYDFENGVYELPFEVIQYVDNKYGNMPSMGDKGFKHPALLIVDNDRVDILLQAVEMQYVAQSGKRLKGKLQQLYYFDYKMSWHLCEKKDEDIWIIPFSKLLYQRDCSGDLTIGNIKIRAAATTVRMPESVAEITFNFKLIKKTDIRNA
jgi:Mn-dependent DtxR family transcriptional regulator